uniref:Cytochrome P450 n=1 Tax=Panagrolaimus sp. JU765 TaxID=591449 RepID=A0AC34QY61_9BILA
MPTIVDTVDHVLNYMEGVCDKPVEIHSIFQEFTMDIISRIALGQEECQLFKNPYMESARYIFTAPVEKLTNTWVTRFPFLKPYFKFQEKIFPKKETGNIVENLYASLYSKIAKRKEEREKKQSKPMDFIDLFLEAESKSTDWETEMKTLDWSNLKVAKQLSIPEIVGQCFVFLLAGYDTTANSLSFLIYELINNPEALEQLKEEVDGFLASENFAYETITNLQYLDACIKESLRLHPVAASIVNRCCMETTKIGEVVVEKGVNVEIDVLSINKNEVIWGEHPEKFRPERWLESETRHPIGFLTFGGGPRICLGMRLALLEEKIMIIKLLERFSLSKCPESEEKLFVRGYNVFYPKSVTLKLGPRQ